VKRFTRAKILEFHAVTTVNPAVTLSCDVAVGLPNKLTVTIGNFPFKSVTPFPFLRNRTVSQSATVRYEGANDGL
jgi:hypothetical protein